MAAMEAQLQLFLLYLLFNSVLTQRVPLSSGSELAALLQLRSSLGVKARYWPGKTDPCSRWTGVDCLNGRVVGINLSGLSRTQVGQLNPRFDIDSLANITGIVSFNSSGFLLPGSIPHWLGQTLKTIQVLDLRSSSILGPIPPSLGALNRLKSLHLSHNSLTGIIPSTLGQLSSLSELDVSSNLFTGSIPSAISGLGNLTRLDLSSNFLSGSIPLSLGSLSNLRFLNLSNNSFSASVPPQLCNLSLLVKLDLGINFLSGPLPGELIGLKSMEKLLVGSNDLSGFFPPNLFTNMPHLNILDVSGNRFTGTLPDFAAFSNATGAMFNFSSNQFYGNVTFPFVDFAFVDISDNYFQGLAPPSTLGDLSTIRGNCFLGVTDQRGFQDCRMFYAQRGLPFDGGLSNSTQLATSRSNRTKHISAGVFGGIGFILLSVLVFFWLIRRCSKRSASQRGTAGVGPVPEEANTQGEKTSPSLSNLGESFTYEQLLQATSSFGDANLIKHGHSGDLFLGRLEGGLSVLIKRIDLHSSKKDSYMVELDFFSKVTTTRLVPLLGRCLDHENVKFLVYKYLPHRDLSSSLFRLTISEDDGGVQSLDWITRLKIATGAAEGLSYLHHECDPPLVHRDIQASSILLDDKYDVRLGSLSEVRAQEADNHQNVITRLLQSSQTPDRDSSGTGLPPSTCAYDVYCFGKVLLELITGRLGISKSDDTSAKEWLDHILPSISISDKEMVAKIVDQSMVIDEDLLEEVWAVAIIGKSCLNPKPSKRPLMRHVLKALENPFKVVREENFSSSRPSSMRSWSTALFGSQRNSFSESGNVQSRMNRGGRSGLKQPGRANSQGTGTNDKRSSSEIFPDPAEYEDAERQSEKT